MSYIFYSVFFTFYESIRNNQLIFLCLRQRSTDFNAFCDVLAETFYTVQNRVSISYRC